MQKHTLGVRIGLFAVIALVVTNVSAQPANPRFGKWKLKSENPPPASNIMTYEPYNGTGMKVTIDTVNASGAKGGWGYITMFDGKDEPVTGQPGNTSAVRTVSDKINVIVNKRNGTFSQMIVNVLSADGKSILNTYYSTNAQTGETRVTTATYERIE